MTLQKPEIELAEQFIRHLRPSSSPSSTKTSISSGYWTWLKPSEPGKWLPGRRRNPSWLR